jgi:pimeloyl-ACP methyl ester carboxylesterase
VYALDLPGMGYSEIVPGASYEEPAMRAAVKDLITQLDLGDVTLVGESMGAVLALTAAADLPERVRRVVAINPYDYAGGIARSGLLARLIVAGVLAPGIGPRFAAVEPKPIMRATTGRARRTARPTGSCSPPPNSPKCREPATSSLSSGPTCRPTC